MDGWHQSTSARAAAAQNRHYREPAPPVDTGSLGSDDELLDVGGEEYTDDVFSDSKHQMLAAAATDGESGKVDSGSSSRPIAMMMVKKEDLTKKVGPPIVWYTGSYTVRQYLVAM